jgi:hypothetical protein
MSVNDPIVVEYYETRESWIIAQGRETFYDEDEYLREFDTEEDAEQWLTENLSETRRSTMAKKATKTAPKKEKSKVSKRKGAPTNGQPFIRLSVPQFELLKKDLIDEQKSGKAPRTREPVMEQILAGKRVKGNVLSVNRNSMILWPQSKQC